MKKFIYYILFKQDLEKTRDSYNELRKIINCIEFDKDYIKIIDDSFYHDEFLKESKKIYYALKK